MAIDGTYDLVVKTPMGEQKSQVTVAADGDKWSGSQTGPDGETVPVEGTVDGDTIKWDSKITKPMPMDISSEATIDGDNVTGSMTAGAFGKFPMTGTRAG